VTQPSKELLEELEVEIEQTLYALIDLELEENYATMNTQFAQLLAKVQTAQLINYKLDVLVEPQAFATETCILLQSLIEAKARPNKRHKLLTHRMILKIWLRKNQRFMREFLPQMFYAPLEIARAPFLNLKFLQHFFYFSPHCQIKWGCLL